MKSALFLPLYLLLMTRLTLPAAGPRDAQWRQVQEAMDKGLPRSALEALEPIVAGSVRDRAWAEATKAIGRRIALQTQIEGRQPDEAVDRLTTELAAAPPELQPVFHTLLANAYWGYYRQNRWRFLQRTATAAVPSADFRTWDLPRLFDEIDRHFTRALAEDARLKSVPIADFDELLVKGTVPDAQRPTLYDFLAHEALEFYQAGEQGLSQPTDAFVLTADGPALGNVEDFLRWTPPGQGTELASPVLKALLLHQTLLRFHQADTDPSAFIAADLDRLAYAYQAATGPTKDDRYLAAVRDIAVTRSHHELSARARFAWAELLLRQERPADARRIATEAAGGFPNAPAARQCRNLVKQIESREVRIGTERIWNAPWPAIDVHYRNVDKVWFRAIAVEWDRFLDRRMPRPERLSRNQRLDLMRRTPALAWSADLPPTPDFLERRHALPAPATLLPGYYLIFASHRADFAETDNQLTVTEIWISNLALVLRPREGRLEGFVLEANSGEPVAGATVEAWYLANNNERVAIAPATTDALGTFSFAAPGVQRGHLVRARKGAQRVAFANDIGWWQPDRTPPGTERSVLFTDRAIYRPGQLVQYKGITLRHDPEHDRYEPLAGRRVTVVFRDVNGADIARQEHEANAFGSFSGTFTAPRDRLTGRMQLQIEGDPEGSAAVQVEEYKRPKFQVTVDAPSTAPRLADTVIVAGRAIAYTGAAIDQARVTWRVTRQVRFAPWIGWFGRGGPPVGTSAQEIAHGTAETGVDGAFQIRFHALPDPAVSGAEEPSFEFLVHADVTDGAGETRSGERSVRVGYTALQLGLDPEEWQVSARPVELRITTRTLDEEPQPTSGTVKIHRLKEPATVQRPPLTEIAGPRPTPGTATNDLSNPNHWELGEVVVEQPFLTGTNGVVTNRFSLPVGHFRAMVESKDRFGRRVTARHPLQVLDPEATALGLKVPNVVTAPKWTAETGETFLAVWGTGYEAGRAFVEVEHRGRIVERYWTTPGRTQQAIRIPVIEGMLGGFTLHVTQVRENRGYLVSRHVTVPWTHKEFDLAWETFRSRLEPGQAETWTAIIKPRRATRGPGADGPAAGLAAELVATLYDASLDAFMPHTWPDRLPFWPTFRSTAQPSFANAAGWFDRFGDGWRTDYESVDLRYRAFPPDLQFENLGRTFYRRGFAARGAVPASGPMLMTAETMTLRARTGISAEEAKLAAAPAPLAAADALAFQVAGGGLGSASATPGPDLSRVAPRKNLNETAFFLPHVVSDSNGVVRLSFTMPEALTEWRFLGFAHDRELRSGLLSGRTVTARDIMVQPNPPRFLREGDELEFTVKVSNRSDARQRGRVRANFAFALDGRSADEILGNSRPELAFDIPASESRSFAWRLRVPDGCGFLTFKAAAATVRQSDGEEGFLPVLSRRVFLTESLPLPIRGPAEKRFTFASLVDAAKSTTLRHSGLTVQMASNPAWYAVLALPYLMEFPHECAEQVFNRLYANALAAHLANRDPRIRAVFDQWRGTAALDSPLLKNEDLKAVAIAETPWLRAARNESEARRNVGILFEPNRLAAERAKALQKLAEGQLPEGGWSWFPGGHRNEFITLYVVTGFGRLRHLGVDIPIDPAVRALDGLDAWMHERWERLRENKTLDGANLDSTVALYLYGRSFFLRDKPVAEPHREAFHYWVAQARAHWLKVERLSQGHIALALTRFGNAIPADARADALAILRSLKERSVVSEELGRYWREGEASWWWYRAPIETQALLIEAFIEVPTEEAERAELQSEATVEELKVWLLKQKQTQDWKTTKATADAVYALLLRGADLLASTRLVTVDIGGQRLDPTTNRDGGGTGPGSGATRSPEPGTGFYEVRFAGPDVSSRLASVVVNKADAGVAWGAVHWQYFEDLGSVKPFEGTPLKLAKALFTRVNTNRGRELVAVSKAVHVGDELVVRIELRVDRDMEYVHLKDQRGSGTEPVNVLSQYRYADGLAIYESTRDTASHFFIDYLPKGTYVFEYPVRVQHRGTYTAGVAEIQCLYAPEFNSHSAAAQLRVE